MLIHKNRQTKLEVGKCHILTQYIRNEHTDYRLEIDFTAECEFLGTKNKKLVFLDRNALEIVELPEDSRVLVASNTITAVDDIGETYGDAIEFYDSNLSSDGENLLILHKNRVMSISIADIIENKSELSKILKIKE